MIIIDQIDSTIFSIVNCVHFISIRFLLFIFLKIENNNNFYIKYNNYYIKIHLISLHF